MAYIFYFNFKENVYEYPLPAVNNRVISIDISEFSSEKGVINLEIFDGVWKLLPSEDFNFSVNNSIITEKKIEDGDKITAKKKRGKLTFMIFALKASENTSVYRKWSLEGVNRVTVGMDENCDIVYKEQFVSHKHATIERKGSGFFLTDNSTNGTFLNGSKISGETPLSIFDTIYILGLKIIFLGEYIATNKILELGVSLTEICDINNDYEPYEDESDFSRSPRRIEPLDEEVIEIESPPSQHKASSQPLIFIIGPSVTMPLPIMISVIINMMSSGNTSNPLMYLGTVISVVCSGFIGAGWALAHQFYNKKTVKKQEEARVKAYGEYIAKNENLLSEKQDKNKRIIDEQFLSSDNLMKKVFKDRTFLWNRNINHADFSKIRFGTGSVKLPNGISVPKERFSMNDDALADKPRELFDRYNTMEDCAYTARLNDSKIWGVIGEYKNVMNIVNNIAVQLSALHSYSDIKIALLCRENEKEKYLWMKWLPHIFSSDRKVRMFGCDSNSLKNVCNFLGGELRSREENAEGASSRDLRFLPHYFVICTDKSILEKNSLSKYIMNNSELGFTFILAYEKMDKLPNECKVIIQHDETYSGIYSLSSTIDETNSVNFDNVDTKYAEKYARAISGLYLTEFTQGEIPASIDYLDMLGIGKFEQWNLIRKYKENRSYESLASFIGVGTGNRPVVLDISEKMHGPHGLIAGTTGSGKSETIQTFILSLILNYSPDEVAFILIDYKGGGMAAAFEGIPHLAGIITNLGGDTGEGEIDETLTRRALISIKSEIKRRQQIFNRYKVNHINQYIKMYRGGAVSEALPHLIIISDEFAELKHKQPEFIKELVSVARVGRSLGVHLILATQKPSGVVDEEIWSNSRFKLCLKVQDKQDSIGMLKRPEAAYLVNTGRAYMQIGNDEIFDMFQSGYSGAEYIPTDEFVSSKDKEVIMIDIDGTYLEENTMAGKGNQTGISQLKAGIDYVINVSAMSGFKPTRKLWNECLPSLIGLDKLDTSGIDFKSGLISCYGIIDNPEKQSQYPAVVDVSKTSHILVSGMSGSGKSTFLQTMVYSLVSRYTPDEIQFYFIDFSSRTTRKFEKLPHCGGVVFQEHNELIERLFRLLENECDERRRIFDKADAGSFGEYTKKNKMPMILVVIDNYAGFSEGYPELAEKLAGFSRDCLKYGVQLVISANNTNDVKYKLMQNIGYKIALRLSDRYGYNEILGGAPEFTPSKYAGRGLVKEDGILEFQTAVPFEIEDETERSEKMIKEFSDIAKKYKKHTPAKRIPSIPKDEIYADFYEKNKAEGMIPLGYDTNDISSVSLSRRDTFCLAVGASEEKSISLMFNNLAYSAKQSGAVVWYFKTTTDMLCKTEYVDRVYTHKELEDFLKIIQKEFETASEIRGKYKDTMSVNAMEEKVVEEKKMLYIFIDNMAEFHKIIYNQKNDSSFAEVIEETFRYGEKRGVSFIAGFGADSYIDAVHGVMCKNFLLNKTVLHIGGHLDQQKLYSSSLPYNVQSKSLDLQTGYFFNGTTERQIFIPLSERGENDA